MEFKEIIAIFRARKKAFWVTVSACIVIGLVWQYSQREYVVADLTLNVTRLGSDKTTDYQYHDFYRLQADERFADTIVRWIASPRMISDIQESARLDPNDRSTSPHLKAERLSSQMIKVTYAAKDATVARRMAQSIENRVNAESNVLNKDQQETSWFMVIGSEPVTQDGRFSLAFALAVSSALGLFLGFWVVLLRHYFTKR